MAPSRRAEIVEIGRDGDDRHHLRGGGDVESGLARVAVRPAAEPTTIWRSERSFMSTQRRQPIVSGSMPSLLPCSRCASSAAASRLFAAADRVDVAGEVEVQVLHRHDLGVAAAGRAALDPEDGPERRLAQAEHGVPPDLAEALGERHRRGRLALARLRRRDRGDADERRVGLAGQPVDDREVDLRLVAAVEVVLVRPRGRSARRCSAIGSSSCACAMSRFEGTFVVAICVSPGETDTAGPWCQWLTAAAAELRTSVSVVEALELERLDERRGLLRRDELRDRRADDR